MGLLDLEEGKTIVTKLFFFPLAVKLNIYIYRERENKILWIIERERINIYIYRERERE